MANFSSTVIVIGLLCVSAITAQDNNEEIIDLFKEQGESISRVSQFQSNFL